MLLAQEYLRALNSGDSAQIVRLSTDTALARHAQALALRIPGTLSAATGERATFYGGRIYDRPGAIAVYVTSQTRSMQSFCYLPGEGDELQLTVRDTPAGLRVAHIGLTPC